MPKRLAITIAGAVSLGTYGAGVLYETIRAIGRHNQLADPDESIEIDVLTGASAGGMTAVISAQRLLYDADSLSKSAYSIFSSDLSKRLSLTHITSRYASGAAPPRKRSPVARCREVVAFDQIAVKPFDGCNLKLLPSRPWNENPRRPEGCLAI